MSEFKILVDTHYLIWDMQGHKRFTPVVENLIKDNPDNVFISSISFWELGMLVSKNKISIRPSIETFISDLIRYRNYKVLNLTPRISDILAAYKDVINGDPADRVIAATAISHNAILVTADTNLRSLSFVKTFV